MTGFSRNRHSHTQCFPQPARSRRRIRELKIRAPRGQLILGGHRLGCPAQSVESCIHGERPSPSSAKSEIISAGDDAARQAAQKQGHGVKWRIVVSLLPCSRPISLADLSFFSQYHNNASAADRCSPRRCGWPSRPARQARRVRAPKPLLHMAGDALCSDTKFAHGG